MLANVDMNGTPVRRDVVIFNHSTHLPWEEQSTSLDGNHCLVEPHSVLLGDGNTSSCTEGNCTDLEKSDLNVYKMAILIWQVCPPIIFFFGTTGNLLILLMLRKLRLGRSSLHIYLRALAITDLVVLYTGLFRWWILWTFDIDLRLIHVSVCKVHLWLVYVSLSVSAWLLVLMTLERTFSVCVPHKVSMFFTKRRAWIFIIFIVVLHGCIQSHFLFGITIISTNGTLECGADAGIYDNFVHKIWPLVDLCILSIFPFICLIVSNTIIVYKTFGSLKNATGLNLTSGASSMRRRNASSMTAILLVLSTFFLLTTSPVCVYNIWEQSGTVQEMQKTPQGDAKSELWWAAVNICMYCNNSLNFYLYCLTGSKFRREMKRQLSRNRSSSTDSRSNMFTSPPVQRFNNMSLREIQRNGRLGEISRKTLTSSMRSSIRKHDSNAYL